MYTELLQKLEAALLKRNPGIGPALSAGVEAEAIRKGLKRAGVQGNVEAIVELYAWHDGATGVASKHVHNLGFTPPVVSEPSKEGIEYLRSLGNKIDANFKVYGAFAFFNFEGVIRSLKHWKKFSGSVPLYAKLAGGFVPFMIQSQTGQQLAVDTGADGGTRVVSVEKDKVRLAYPSFMDFLQDAIVANESNQVLAWFRTPGEVIELAQPVAAAVKLSGKAKKKTIPETKNIPAVRVDFSDDAGWESLVADFARGRDEGGPEMDFVSDKAFEGLTAKQLPKVMPESGGFAFAVIIDQTTIAHVDRPVLVVDLQEKPGRSFRAARGAFGEVYDNLSIANMDFGEFVNAVEEDGIFRGFGEMMKGE